MPSIVGHVILTLQSEKPEITEGTGGTQRVRIAGFGSDTAPGAPALPLLACHVELPRSAEVSELKILGSEHSPLSGHYRIQAAGACVHDEPVEEGRRLRARRRASRIWSAEHDAIYAQDAWYPATPVTLYTSWKTATCTVVVLHLSPVQYNPERGRLLWHQSVKIDLGYRLPEAGTDEIRDVSLTTGGDIRLNPFRVVPPRRLTPAGPTAGGIHNYLIIVPDAAIENAMADFKLWKERLGHSVAIVRLPDILAAYAGADDAERIRNCLISKYEEWRVHYVLMVGAMGVIPTRLLYMDDATDAYASDFYFANLVTVDWDLDNDNRWGEFADDRYNYFHDVVVGRLPLNTAADVKRYCDNVIAYEQDTGPWKQKALFAAGFMDHDPTDGAELCERLIDDVLTPAGWSARKLYEKGGTYPSKYACDSDLDQANYAAECTAQRFGLVSLVAHGNWDYMVSKQCTDPQRHCDGNTQENRFGDSAGIPASCPSAVVSMIGCSTACPVPNYKHVETGTATPPLRSLFPFAAMHEHNGVRYLRHGAVAAVGSSAGVDYAHGWTSPNDGKAWSLAYYFHDNLVTQRKPVGDAFFDALRLHSARHKPLLRGVRDFYLLGDPSLMSEGVTAAAEGSDVVVHHGRWSQFSACNDRNGDLYVAVSIGASAEPARLVVYKSTDHGSTWSKWQDFSVPESVIVLDAIVNHGGADEFKHDDLLLFTTSLQGSLRLHKLPLSGSSPASVAIATPGAVSGCLSVSQDSLRPASRVYLGYWFYDAQGRPHSVVGVSSDNGLNWHHWKTFSGYFFPAIDAGPNNRLYVAAMHEGYREHIHISCSGDGGATWGNWTNLTAGDDANFHFRHSPPTVAASSDPGKPSVWVVYERGYDGSYGPRKCELGFACSSDSGTRWTRNLTLAAGPGNVQWPQLLSYKADPNPWLNVIYLSMQQNAVGMSAGTARVMWRAVSGEWPSRWRPAEIGNHVDTGNARPRLVYSPGAPGTGGGMVFAGPDGLYFSARWLHGNS
ncbi:MAG: C25 family cysteine peptidase [Acidihalobacter sp.]